MRRFGRPSTKTFLAVALLLVALAAAVVAYLHFHNRNPANLVNDKQSTAVKGNTSQPAPHKLPANNSAGTGQSGGAVDKSGQTSGTLPPPSQWVSSNSGNITIQLPSPDTVVKSGDTLSGLAKVGTVRFLLKDDVVGLIAQGNLSVVNGKFSGLLQFTPHSSSGKLEVYYPNPSNGAEEDLVEINVSFNAQ